jgi:Protein of unknown function (DUF3572)
MIKKLGHTSLQAEALALQMLAFIAADDDRLQSFMALSGIPLESLKDLAADPQFLAGVMDHLLADQSALLAFCAEQDITPESAVRARHHLPGAAVDF